MTQINKCCSCACGCLTFLFGLIYILIPIFVTSLCYTPALEAALSLAGNYTDAVDIVICGEEAEAEYFNLTNTLVFLLLVTSGCLGYASGKTQSDGVVSAYFVVSVLATLMSAVAVVQYGLGLYVLSDGDLEALADTVGGTIEGDVDDVFATMAGQLLLVTSLYFACSVSGFLFATLSTIVAFKAVTCHNKVDAMKSNNTRQNHVINRAPARVSYAQTAF